MLGLKKVFAGVILAALVAASPAFAVPIVTSITDSGTLVTSTHTPPSSTSVANVLSPYGAGSMTITPVASGWKLTFAPTSGFGVSVNNLAGGKTQTFAGLIGFDIEFDSAINLTTNVYEGGTYARSGTGRVAVNSFDLASGILVTQLDGGPAEQRGNSFATSAIVAFNTPPAGTWSLFGQVTGFSKAYKKYHVVVDNDLLAEALAGAPSSGAIAKKDFSIIFTSDGSSGGGPIVPEPASLGMLALGSAALLMRRRR